MSPNRVVRMHGTIRSRPSSRPSSRVKTPPRARTIRQRASRSRLWSRWHHRSPTSAPPTSSAWSCTRSIQAYRTLPWLGERWRT
ncbi:uncharacterized protein K444DRAFT_25845 [Hyaloscypha bicolor E]|uniref:Uncharacterized protein n=1 Tax=Hyaloscypha bicolor E TaxID=1095630 RepID=A0A2J6T4A1_9HELO|nr:uncharacterized protein K444DRAFT_25845 [Hyaloscypha bicolor E]PMD57839.1 hypothetical protein K444DRAFT_25845 [Hyaloscypha bicolor E]